MIEQEAHPPEMLGIYGPLKITTKNIQPIKFYFLLQRLIAHV
jgi:hypothetical protein